MTATPPPLPPLPPPPPEVPSPSPSLGAFPPPPVSPRRPGQRYSPTPGYIPPQAFSAWQEPPPTRSTPTAKLSLEQNARERERSRQLDRIARTAAITIAAAGAIVVGVATFAANYVPPDPACYPLPCEPGFQVDDSVRNETNQLTPAPSPTLPVVGGADDPTVPYGSGDRLIPPATTPYGRSQSSDGMGR